MQIVLAYLATQTVIGELAQEPASEEMLDGQPEGDMPMVTFINRPYQVFAMPAQGRLSVSLVPMCSNFGATPPISRYYPVAEHLLAGLLEAPAALADEYRKAVSGLAMAPANSPILQG